MFTYIMKNDFGLIKVGISSDVNRRVKEVKNSSGVYTTLEFFVEGNYEKEVHKALLKHRKCGEWFDIPLEQCISVLKLTKTEIDKQVDEHVKNIENMSNSFGDSVEDSPLEELLTRQPLVLTKNELKKVNTYMLNRLIKFAGGLSHLSRMIDTPITTLQGWVRRGAVSKKGAVLISFNNSLNKVYTPKFLRPDLTDEQIEDYTLEIESKLNK